MLMGIEATTTNSKVNVEVFVNGKNANAVIDTGSTLSHFSSEFSKRLNIDLENCDCSIGLAVKSYSSKGLGKCAAAVKLNGQIYNQVSFTVLEDLLTDVILVKVL